jgi:CyaY protein
MASPHDPANPEQEYRARLLALFERILRALDAVDPDVCEAELSQGALSIRLANGARWVLSGQPPVRQLWLAVASRGRAYHFNFDTAANVWRDDKGEGLEAISLLERLLKEDAGLDVRL